MVLNFASTYHVLLIDNNGERISEQQWSQVIAWCSKHNLHRMANYKSRAILFKGEKELNWFRLKWT
jgi:hypothetical protein